MYMAEDKSRYNETNSNNSEVIRGKRNFCSFPDFVAITTKVLLSNCFLCTLQTAVIIIAYTFINNILSAYY